MTKRKLFEEIRESLEAIRDGEAMPHREIPMPDVKAIRKSLAMSQAQTRTLLRIMEKEPRAVMRALHT